MAYGYVYITENLVNGKKYIGQSTYNKKGQCAYLGSGKFLKQAIKKYGKNNFIKTILEDADSLDLLNDLERYYIQFYNAIQSREFYNISPGGRASLGFTGKTHSKETKQRMKKSYKRPLTENVKNACRINGYLSSQNPAARAKHAKAISGANHPRAVSVEINGILYDTLTQANKETGISFHNLRKLL